MRQDVINRLEREDTNPTADRIWAIICERAGYKCEYCDKDMLASLDNYLSMQRDHIIPRNAQGSETVNNYALSCAACNDRRLKGSWNPASVVGDDACRDELIQAVRQHVRERRSNKHEEFSRYQQIVGYFGQHGD